MSRRRQAWGSVRRLPSGRFQARYRVDGVLHAAPRTFATRREADSFLAGVRAAIERGTWIDPDAGSVLLATYAARWLDDRAQLRVRTREQYESLLRLHVLPALGDAQLVQLTSARIRSWHAGMLRAGRPGASTTAKAYRLLKTMLTTAVERRAHLPARDPGARHRDRQRAQRSIRARPRAPDRQAHSARTSRLRRRGRRKPMTSSKLKNMSDTHL